jgi:protein SCO1/2
VLLCAVIAAPVALAAGSAESMDEHAHHHAAITGTTRSVASYHIPDVQLTREDERIVNLGEELNDGRAVVVAFIYTSCTTVCPLTSRTLLDLQSKLGSARDHVHLLSISIDPEQDTPARLRDYARTFHAGPEWQHYTGTLSASQTVQRAFDVYRGDKMAHVPALIVRAAPGADWVRIEGFATAEQLLAELPVLHAAR